MADRDASSAPELQRRLQEVESTLAAAQARIDVLERTLAAAGVTVPGQAPAEPPAAADAADAADRPAEVPATTAAPVDARAAQAALAAADAGGSEAPAATADAPPAAAEPPPAAASAEHQQDPELAARIDGQRRALHKRGFRRDDVFFHPCTSCGVQAVEKYAISGKSGGRDIDLCLHCGASASWRRRPEKEDRERDTTFDLATFLR